MSGLGLDRSGNGNNWQENSITSTDQMVDTPTNNFCTWNPLYNSSYTLSEGNLKWAGSTSTNSITFGTFGVASGLWYWEQYLTSTIHSPPKVTIGFSGHEDPLGMDIWSSSANKAYFWYPWNGNVYISGTTYTSFSNTTASTGDVIGIAIDLDNGYMYLSKNGSWMNSGVPTSGATGTGGIPVVTGHTHYPLIDEGATGTSEIATANFGQDSSFAGNDTTTAGPYTDSGGVGDFFYEPPTDYLALCTSNLTAPAVKPQENFNTVTYSGTGGTQSITGVGFQPDWVWLKDRVSSTAGHNLTDVVRGAGKSIFSNNDAIESVDSTSGHLEAFDTDGFELSGGSRVNTNTNAFVAWNWKAGNATLGTGDFTQGSIASTCSRNVDAGFSIVSYTGTGSLGTVGHGLASKPEMIIVKNRSSSNSWAVLHKGIASDYETDFIKLDSTAAATDNDAFWNDTEPTTSLFTVNIGSKVNGSVGGTENIIAYCFHSVDGYSKVGSYTGNASTDGTFVYTGFRPAYVLIRLANASAGGRDWYIFDSERNDYNVVTKYMRPNVSTSEGTGDKLDFTSNGFKVRASDDELNDTGKTHIYLAFAETPFKYSTAR
jgi:hypothetical protein